MWIQTNKNYFRKLGDSRVPFQNYGVNKFKSFFSVFELKGTDIVYVANNGNSKLDGYEDSLDFKKFLIIVGRSIGTIHLNTMFPVHKDDIIEFSY